MSSLAALALRLSAMRLLEGQTYADRVYDSAIAPIDSMVTQGGKRPAIIVVSTGDENSDHEGIDVLTAPNGRMIDLIIEVAIADEIAEGGATVPPTDAGLELSLSLISRQIYRALFEAETPSPWLSVFRGMVAEVTETTSKRGIPEPNGDRFAARQIIMRIHATDEPRFGRQPEGVWAEFVSAVEGDAEMAPLGPVIRASMVGDDLHPADIDRAALGIRPEAAPVVDVGPLPPIREQPPLGEVEIGDDPDA